MSLHGSAYEILIRFMYGAKESLVSTIQDLELLFEIFRIADKVPVPYRFFPPIGSIILLLLLTCTCRVVLRGPAGPLEKPRWGVCWCAGERSGRVSAHSLLPCMLALNFPGIRICLMSAGMGFQSFITLLLKKFLCNSSLPALHLMF
jgi:hypothetical protein